MEMKIQEIAKLYGVSRQAVYQWLDKGLAYKYEMQGKGMVIKVRKEDLDKFIEQKKKEGRKYNK